MSDCVCYVCDLHEGYEAALRANVAQLKVELHRYKLLYEGANIPNPNRGEQVIHIRRGETLKTYCRNPIARRWWVSDATVLTGFGPGGIGVWASRQPTDEADCETCCSRFGEQREREGGR